MLRLDGGTIYLLLHRSPNGKEHRVAIRDRFDRTVKAWEFGTRVSPLYALNGASPPSLQSDSQRKWVLFFGPLRPATIAVPPTPHCFLSLGLFNFVVFSSTEAQRQAALHVARAAGVRWEEWTLDGNRVSRQKYSNDDGAYKVRGRHRKTLDIESSAAAAPAREYSILFPATMSRAQVFTPQCVKDLDRFDTNFRGRLLGEIEPDSPYGPIQPALLVRANAALAHFSSQTFSGTQPILHTECHYWPHSLLGIGIASLALFNIRAFVEKIFTRACFVDRFVRLNRAPAHPTPLEGLGASDEFWRHDHLFMNAIQEPLAKPGAITLEDVLPLITCFSGRDNFSSTDVSLSAPLDSISACNTPEFAFGTLTHEISHQYVEGFLGEFLRFVTEDDKGVLRTKTELLLTTGPCASLYDQIQAFLCLGFWKSSSQHWQQKLSIGALIDLILNRWRIVNEVLTHCFDFLYFYRRDPKSYIQSIWTTWGVLPSSYGKVSEYILRSLCALLTANIGRSDEIDITIDQFLHELNSTRDSFPHSPYVREALSIMSDDGERAEMHNELQAYNILVKIARFFLYSETIERLFVNEPLLVGGGHRGYRLKQLTFPDEIVRNPLRFVDTYSTDRHPDALRSAWLIHQLAFMDTEPW